MTFSKLGRILVALALFATIVASVKLLERDGRLRQAAEPKVEDAAELADTGSLEPESESESPGEVSTREHAADSASSASVQHAPATEVETSRPGLEVEVLDEDGRGVPHIAVRIVFEDEEGRFRGTGKEERTGDSGTCVLDPSTVVSRSTGPWWRLEGWTTFARLVVVPQRVREGTGRVTLAALRPGQLVGSVSRRDGKSVGESARLEIHWRVGESPESERDVGVEDGAFETGELVGRVTRIVLTQHPAASLVLLPDLVIPPGETVRADLVFEAGPVLLATLLDSADRRPIAGVRMTDPVESDSASDERGRLAVPDVLCSGKEIRVTFAHDDYSPATQRVTAPSGATEWPLTIELERSPVLSGVVMDARSLPLPGLEVHCHRSLEGGAGGMAIMAFSKRTTTDDEGRFRLSGLPARGAVRISFSRREGSRRAVLWAEDLELPQASARERWVIPDTIAIRGRVIDAEGSPVPEASISAKHSAGEIHRSATAGQDGEFEIADAVPGRWSLWVVHGGTIRHANQFVRQRSVAGIEVGVDGARGVAVRLGPERVGWKLVSLRLRVLDAASGEPLTQSLLAFSGRDVQLDTAMNEELRDGWMEVQLPEGSYDVLVQEHGFLPAIVFVELGPSGHERVIEMTR